MLGTECCGKHAGRGHAFFGQCTCYGECALGRQLQVVHVALVALGHAAVVGESAHHQHFVAPVQVHAQRGHQALEQLPAFGPQLVGVDREQHVAANTDASVVQRDAARLQRDGQGFLERHTPLFFGLAFFDLGIQVGHQVHLHHQHTHQHQHKRTQQPGHQVAEDSPDRSGLFHAIVAVVHVGHHSAASACAARCWCSWRRSSTMPCCDVMLRSITSRACAT